MDYRKIVAAAMWLLLTSLANAYAETSDGPFLPKCGRGMQQLSPVPLWSPSPAEITHLIAADASDSEKIVYLAYAALADDVTVEETDVAYTISVHTPLKTKDTKPLKVLFKGKPQFANGYYFFFGFYALTYKTEAEAHFLLQHLDTFDIVSSRRFCFTDAASMPRQPPRAPPPSTTATAPSLPWCHTAHERRIPIPTWKPRLTGHEYIRNFRRLPPTGDGRIVYIWIDQSNTKCPRDPDHLFTFGRPDDEKHASAAGGIAVNLRGNFASYGEGCRLQGFYMNQPVYGMHQGWTETYFAPIDKSRIEATGQYCMARGVIR